MVYYNEFDPKKAAWLRELIRRDLIAPGEVDERSIEDVLPNELRRFTQCHFFAGIGGWSLALRQAGWPDEMPVWTGSCPCQPFSAAGKGKGFSDERHLWPAWFHLIDKLRPVAVFGEQVANAVEWLRLVQGDLEAVGYSVGSMPIEAACVGAPHRRDRLWFVADSKWNEQPRGKSRCRTIGRMGRLVESVPWDQSWQSALSRFRVLGDGLPRRVDACDAARDAIVPQVAEAFIRAYLETKPA